MAARLQRASASQSLRLLFDFRLLEFEVLSFPSASVPPTSHDKAVDVLCCPPLFRVRSFFLSFWELRRNDVCLSFVFFCRLPPFCVSPPRSRSPYTVRTDLTSFLCSIFNVVHNYINIHTVGVVLGSFRVVTRPNSLISFTQVVRSVLNLRVMPSRTHLLPYHQCFVFCHNVFAFFRYFYEVIVKRLVRHISSNNSYSSASVSGSDCASGNCRSSCSGSGGSRSSSGSGGSRSRSCGSFSIIFGYSRFVVAYRTP